MPHLPLLLLFSSFFQTSRPYLSPDLTQAPFPLDTPAPSAPWDPPSPNSTDHLIFSSVSSLLHTWHNTRYRNGHTIVPGTIPKGTLLHHGTSKKQLPTTPEWTALDPEFSYMFCHTAKKTEVQGNGKDDEGGPTGGEGCWHLTLRTTRPLNILYFDGSSAAKTYGSLDAQDLIVFGNDLAYDGTDRDSPSRVFDESERLRRLCQWGRKYQLDGFVRMQSSFEVMLCDFTVGVEEISFLNLVSDLERAEDSDEDDKEERDGPAEPDQPTLLKVYGSIDVGLRHGSSSSYSSPETRVHLDFTRLISFYDTSLFPSLADGREKTPSKATSLHNSYSARNRFQKGLLDTQLIRGTWRVGPIGGISEADRERLMGRLDEILKIDRPLELGGTEVDWVSLYRQVKDRYAERLEILYHILSSSADNPGSRRKSLLNARAYVDTLLTPYILYGLKPSPPPSLPDDPQLHAWAAPVLEHCSNHFVPSSSYALTPSERTLVSGLRGTTREICRVPVHLWALGAESDVGLEGISALSSSQIRDLHETYLVELTSLVSWLDWSTPWIRCPSTPSHPSSFILSDGCSFEETCYFPTWPFFHNLDPVIPGLPMRNWPSKPPTRNASDLPPDPPARRGDKDSDVDTSEWLFPQPRCIRRIFPLHLP